MVNDAVNLYVETPAGNHHLFSDTPHLFFAPAGGKFV